MLLLGGECKPFVTPLPCPLLSPHPWRGQGWPGGLGNPQDKETRTVAKWALGTPHTHFRGKGLVGLPPPTSYPVAPPPYTLHLQGNLVLSAGAFIFLRGGRREGRPFREPPPWGSSDNGADTSWAVPPPSAHQDPPLAVVQLVPKHRKPQAGFRHTISWPPWPPLPPPITIPHIWDTFRSEEPRWE